MDVQPLLAKPYLPVRGLIRPSTFPNRKRVWWCSIGLVTCLMLTVVYIPLFYTITLRQVARKEGLVAPSFEWTANLTRDVATYVQPNNVTAIIPNASFCNSSVDELFLLVIVCSAVENFEARSAIRETWAYFQHNKSLVKIHSTYTNANVKIAFLLGETYNITVQNTVSEESYAYGDIIQEGFKDSYMNLTLKSVMLLKWVATYCPQAKYVFKTDDDMFVNIPELLKYLVLPANLNRDDLIGGSLFCRSKPIKDHHSKWYSPQFMFEGKEYPDYVSGTGYALSGALVPRLLNASLEVPLFHLEDIFVTGLVAAKIQVVPENYHRFTYFKHALNQTCLYHHIITSHGLSSSEKKTVWSSLQDPHHNCTSYKVPKIGEPKLKKCPKVKQKPSWFGSRQRG